MVDNKYMYIDFLEWLYNDTKLDTLWVSIFTRKR